MIQEDKSATLACNNDQTVFVPVCIQGSMLNRKLENGPNGTGINEEGVCFTLNTIDRHAITAPSQIEDGKIIYLARKLTPTECASLQGFEKDWCSLVPHKDAPEYKMWGNGMAFPCMLYIMEGVQQVLSERYLDSLFGGDAVND